MLLLVLLLLLLLSGVLVILILRARGPASIVFQITTRTSIIMLTINISHRPYTGSITYNIATPSNLCYVTRKLLLRRVIVMWKDCHYHATEYLREASNSCIKFKYSKLLKRLSKKVIKRRLLVASKVLLLLLLLLRHSLFSFFVRNITKGSRGRSTCGCSFDGSMRMPFPIGLIIIIAII